MDELPEANRRLNVQPKINNLYTSCGIRINSLYISKYIILSM